MKKVFLLPLLFLFLQFNGLQAQCPSCQVNVPNGLAADTIFLGTIPDGQNGMPYGEDVSFRLPLTTTPVNATDPDVPPNLPINEIVISSISNLPPGLSWKANQSSYTPADNSDGCIRFCGKPLVSGWYTLEVTLTATVIVVSQETSFFIDMYIAPAVSNNDGFSMSNFEGCGSVDVSFINNIPSNGNPGYSYFWDFGNGNSTSDENPADQTYDDPGIYFVNYTASIDTTGYILTNVTLLESDCQDILGAAPDILIKVYNSAGQVVYTSPKVMNTFPPISFPTNIVLEDGNYAVEAIDEDMGLGGADDQCAYLNFNRLSDGVQTGPGFKMDLEIINPLSSINYTDTVVVFPEPDQPAIAASQDAACPGDSVLLASSYLEDNQWYVNGELIADATDRSLYVSSAGLYQVVHTNSFGCSAMSEPFEFSIYEAPAAPEIDSNEGDELCDGEETILNSSYAQDNQWYLDGAILNGETSRFLTASTTGAYNVVYTSPDGCNATSADFSLTVFDLPDLPVFENTDNILELLADIELPDNYSLQWQLNGTDMVGETSSTICVVNNGTYTLWLFDEDTECSSSFSAEVTVDPEISCILGVEIPAAFQVSLAPNPVVDWLQLKLELEESHLVLGRLRDLSGREWKSWNFGTQQGRVAEMLDLSELSAGMYLLQLQIGEQIQQVKVVKY